MRTRRFSIIFGLLFLAFFQVPASPEQKNRTDLSLRETFDLYVKSVQSSDLESLFSTISENETFFFLTSGGRLVSTRSGYYNFHECTPISRTFQDSDSGLPISAEQKFLLDTLKSRRTVRKFKPTPVPQDHLMKILDAARFAPTAGNQQPWIFLVIRDRSRLDSLKEASLSWALEAAAKRRPHSSEELASVRESLAKTLQNVLSAPVYVAVLTDSKSGYPDYNVYDGSLAAGTLMIAARALGYGTGFYTSYFPEARMKEFFGIPDRYNLICFTPIGVPEEWPQAPAKKALADIVVFDKFDKPYVEHQAD